MADRKNEKGFLTSTDRKFLRGDREYDSKHSRYERRKSIRERARGAFRDFALLAEQLPENEREKIFSTGSNEEYRELENDLMDTIRFMYVGAGSEGRFRRLLKQGVMEGEAERLPQSSHRGLVSVHFEVEPAPVVDIEATADHLKNSETRKISGADAIAFLQAALAASPEFDNEFIDQILEDRERMAERIRQRRKHGRPGSEKMEQDDE